MSTSLRNNGCPARKRLFTIVTKSVLVAAALFPLVVRSTPPEWPYQRLYFSGNITRPSGGPLDGYAVVALVKPCCKPEFEIIKSRRRHDWYTDVWISLTDTLGEFRLAVFAPVVLLDQDSLAVGIVLPGRTAMGNPFLVGSVSPDLQYKTVTSDDGGYCSSPDEHEVVDVYHYRYPDQTIELLE